MAIPQNHYKYGADDAGSTTVSQANTSTTQNEICAVPPRGDRYSFMALQPGRQQRSLSYEVFVGNRFYV